MYNKHTTRLAIRDIKIERARTVVLGALAMSLGAHKLRRWTLVLPHVLSNSTCRPMRLWLGNILANLTSPQSYPG